MQIPIINGIYTNLNADFGTTYPVNLIPVPKDIGVNTGYMKQAEGLELLCETNGIDRGGIVWNNIHYRVIGNKFVSVSENGIITEIGIVDNDNTNVTFKYSFDRLGIASAKKLYYYNNSTFVQVTDPDLGNVIDLEWIDGYFMTTDGDYLIVTELTDPTQIDALKYGSSEVDPDKIKSLLKLRDEIYVLNRHTIEVFNNVGGSGFPFQRVSGGQMDKGTIGTNANCVYMDTITFIGSGRNESIGIYSGVNGNTTKISTREIDSILEQYTEYELSLILMEVRTFKNHQLLYIHLKDRTIVFDGASSQALGNPVWFILTSSINGYDTYKARNFVLFNNKWYFGDPTTNRLGYLVENKSSHFDNQVRWEFNTTILYNNSRSAIIHELELVCLSGRAEFGLNPTIYTSYSLDGINWSNPRFINSGNQGQYNKRLVWRQLGTINNMRIQKFQGTSDSFINIARLETQMEALSI